MSIPLGKTLLRLGLFSLGFAIPLTLSPLTLAQVPTLEGEEELEFQESAPLTLPSGTKIFVSYNTAEKILVAKDETMPLTLTVARDISQQGQVLIPGGSKIQGRLEPSGGGSRFVAEELIIGEEERYNLQATSGTVTTTESIEEDSEVGEELKNTALSAAAATLAAVMNGETPTIPRELIGTTLLEVISDLLLKRDDAELIAVRPDQDLHLTLLADLQLNPEQVN